MVRVCVKKLVSILVILVVLCGFLAFEGQAKKVKKKQSGNKKKVDSSSSKSFFFVGKLDATSSCVEYNPSYGGEGQLQGSHFEVLMTPKKVSNNTKKSSLHHELPDVTVVISVVTDFSISCKTV